MPVQFISPSFLWFLSLIAIPVIIHLFNFRRFKKVLFTNVKFLKELKEETNSRSRLRHLLVLLSRILAIIFLVLAFAQPFIPVQKQNVISGETLVSIYLDNSFSMVSQSEEGSLLELAKAKALEVINAFPAGTQFQLLTNQLAGVQQRLLSKEEIVDEIAKTKTGSATRQFNEIIARQQEVFSVANAANKQSYLISDFQKTFFPESLRSDSTLNLNLISLTSNSKSNVYIDSCWLSSPFVRQNETVELTVKFKNSGNAAVENVPVKLLVNGTQKAVTTVAISADGEALAKLNFTVTQPGWQQAEVVITDNPITFDDAYYFSFDVANKIDVYHISGRPNIYLNTLFGNNTVFNYTSAGLQSVDYSLMQKSSTVVLSDAENVSSGLATELQKFIRKGGSVILFPDSVVNTNSYNAFLSSINADAIGALNYTPNKIDRLDLENSVFKSVFEKQNPDMNLPGVSSYFEIATTARTTRKALMFLRGGSPFLCEYGFGKGKLYLFAVAAGANQSGFVKHALFVPVVTRIAFLSTRLNELSYTVASNSTVQLRENVNGSSNILHLVNKEKNIDVIPDVRNSPEGSSLFLNPDLSAAGFYSLQNNNSVLQVIALNYNRAESVLNFYNTEELAKVINPSLFKSLNILSGLNPSITKSIKEQSQGISLWKYCIILVLVFLGIEVALLRLMK